MCLLSDPCTFLRDLSDPNIAFQPLPPLLCPPAPAVSDSPQFPSQANQSMLSKEAKAIEIDPYARPV